MVLWKAVRIIIKQVGNEITSGLLNEFIEDHRQGLKYGKIFIGPFYQEYQVQQSQLLYKYAGKKMDGAKLLGCIRSQ